MNLRLTLALILTCVIPACSNFAIKPVEKTVPLPLLVDIWSVPVSTTNAEISPGELSAPVITQTIDAIYDFVESDKKSKTNLLEAIGYAQKSDYLFKVALEKHNVAVNDIGVARTLLFPSINGEANAVNDRIESSVQSKNSPQQSIAIRLRQPLYDKSLSAGLSESVLKKFAADSQIQVEYENLISRVIKAYISVLKAHSDLDFRELDLQSIRRQVEESKKLFEFGSVTSIDIAEITAQQDQALSASIDAETVYIKAMEAFSALTGLPTSTALAALNLSIPFTEPTPATADGWTTLALAQNKSIQADVKTAEAAAQRIDLARSTRFPTVGLNGSILKNFGTDESSEENYRLNISLTMAVPLFDGGRTGSAIAKEKAVAGSASYQAEFTKTDEVRQVRGYYHDVMSSIRTVTALRQALRSNEAAIEAVEAGFRFGSRTALEVLRTRRSSLQSKNQIERAALDYVESSLLLNLSAGILSAKTLNQFSQWLR